jgi:hypothetical protein
LPRDRTGDLANLSGERVAGEAVEYAAPVVDSFPAYPYSADEILAEHRARLAMRLPPPAPRPAPFRHRSLRRV